MQNCKAQILSTRPINEALINQAASQHILIDVLSFIETERIDSLEVHGEIDNALLKSAVAVFTSMNAVEAVAAHIDEYKPNWKIYCIGNTTKKLVIDYFGEEMIVSTATDAAELANKIVEDDLTSQVTFFCGDKRRDELPVILHDHNIGVHEIKVYQTIETNHVVEKNYNGILFFSPSAVKSFFSNNVADAQTIFFAIGTTTATAIKNIQPIK